MGTPAKTMSYKLVVLAALLSAVALAAPRGHSQVEDLLVDAKSGDALSPKVESLKHQFNQLQVQLKAGDKVTPEVASTVKKLIDMVTNDIEPTIKEAHDADQDEINTLMGAFKSTTHSRRNTQLCSSNRPQ